MRSRSILSLAACVACLGTACTHNATTDPGVTEVVFDAVTTLGDPVVIPLLEADLPIIDAEIPGCGRARLLIDSAMELTLLDRSFAERCGLPQRPFGIEFQIDTAGGRLHQLKRVAHIDRIVIGNASATGLDAPLAELSELSLGIDGILGQDVLGDWALLFMPARRELVILPSEGITKQLARFLPSGTPMESMQVHGDDRIPNILFTFGGATSVAIDLHVDTGSTHTTLPRKALDVLGLTGGKATEATTLAGTEARHAWKIEGFPLGTQRLELIIQDTDKETGLLGYDALSQRIFVLDGPGRRLLVEAPGH